tara:strand:- start:40 stop:447 length:408 start_codon:yes stop_codon:yes gene_type:complete
MDDLSKEAFRKFIIKEEGRRGYAYTFSGESNTTLRSFFSGIFYFLFRGRVKGLSSYSIESKRAITYNYINRINNGSVIKFPMEIIEKHIQESDDWLKKNTNYLNENEPMNITRLRHLERAVCYREALNSNSINGK